MESISYSDLTPLEKLQVARVQIQDEKPFFSYLMMHLQFIEQKDMMKNSPGGIGVDKYGNVYYDPKFINSLSKEEVQGSLAHEAMHCVFDHLKRTIEAKQNHMLSNISQDIVVNNTLLSDGMKLPKGCALPENNQMNIFGYHLKKIDEKISEEIYDELYNHLGDEYKRAKKQMKDAIDKEGESGFDIHIQSDEGENSESEKSESNSEGLNEKMDEKDWKKILVDAATYAREKGDLPAGMQRIIDTILDTSIDWRSILYRYISNQIPVDYTYKKPSKRSYSLGYYIPSVEKESIDVIVAIDTSGSISQDELTEFMSEVLSITNSFSNVELTLIECDADIHGVHSFKHATADDAANQIELKGGGGTSHIPVFKWINENKPTARFIICFTDGYTSFPSANQVDIQTLWVVAGDYRLMAKDFPFGDVIELPKRN